jgi:hypothetical protein
VKLLPLGNPVDDGDEKKALLPEEEAFFSAGKPDDKVEDFLN